MKKSISVIVLLLLNFFMLHAQEALKVGDTAPAFTAKNQDGKNISLSDYKRQKSDRVFLSERQYSRLHD